MKKRLVLVAILIVVAVLSAGAQAHNRGSERLGLGIIVGTPAAGLSAEYWLGDGTSVDGALAWSFGDDTGLYLHGDLLFHFMVQRLSGGPTLAPYIGPGAALTLADELVLAARVPIGANLLFNAVPVGLFLEIAPTFTVIPESGFGFAAGFGARFYF